MNNFFCHLCGGLVDLIGMQPSGVRLCGCAATMKTLRAEVERLRNALDWIADPRGNNVCTPQEIAEAALGRAKP